MKFPVACLLIAVCLVLLSLGRAQSNGSDATPPEKRDQPQGNANRVWDEEKIRKLKGGVSGREFLMPTTR